MISDEANAAVEQLYDCIRYRQHPGAARDRVKALIVEREKRIRELEEELRATTPAEFPRKSENAC